MVHKMDRIILQRCAVVLLLLISVSSCSDTRDYGKGSGTPGQYKVGQPYEIDGIQYFPREDFSYSETGIASWYGPGFHGKRTANGESFDSGELTAAHRTLPMPSLVRVTNLDNGKSVVVRVNDRGPFANNRIIDLSQRAAELLDFASQGTAKVRVDMMAIESKAIADAAKKRGYVAPLRGESRGETQLASKSEFIMPKAEMQNGEGITETAKVEVVDAVPLEPSSTSVESTELAAPVTAQAAPVPKIMTKMIVPQPAKKQVALAPKRAVGAPTPLVREPKLTTVPGHVVQGRFYPSPQVKQMKLTGKDRIYIQAGAFAKKENASRMKQNLSKLATATVSEVSVKGKKLFRVRLGPLKDVKEADRVLAKVLPQSDKARITVE